MATVTTREGTAEQAASAATGSPARSPLSDLASIAVSAGTSYVSPVADATACTSSSLTRGATIP